MIYEKSKAKNITADKSKIKEVVHGTIDKMATIVGATLGPGGRPVLIERDSLSPLITKDGVTVAKSLGVENAEANIIIDAAKEICLKTAKEALEYGLVLHLDLEYRLDSFHVHLTYQKLQQPQ